MKPGRLTAVLVAAAVLLGACLPSAASARDLRKRVAIGFNNNFSSVTSVSFKMGLPTPKPTHNLQIQALIGFGIHPEEENRFFAGGRALIPILAEDNLNLYAGVGAGYLKLETQGNALRAQAVLGVEFFFFGLENLGISAEFGLNLDVVQGQISLETTTGTAGSVGAHYYF